MHQFRISNKGTAQLFESRILEKLTRTPFLFPVSLYYLIAAACIVYAALYAGVPMIRLTYLFPLGLLTFTLVEYLIHRYVFHFTPVNEKQEKIQYSIHGVHHEFPRDKDRLAMPPVISIGVAFLFFVIFYLLLGKLVWLFYPGFTAGYSTYLVIHYAVHRYRPPSNFLKYLWKHHSLHHYKSDESAFSVSFPFWDILFKTMPAVTSKKEDAADKLPDYHGQ
jgi:sterol desaturase/sphingolipid hydroxylase (fatty acid hydroxylase superfamily)